MSKMVISGLHAGYEKHVEILKGIDIEIKSGEVLGIIGLNGSGKSTLGKAIMNLLPYRSGRFIFNDSDITTLNTKDLSRKGLSIMRQGGQVFSSLTVSENLDVAFGARNNLSYREFVYGMIPLLNEKGKNTLKQTADKLSGGQRHQLALAMTLATEPSFVILDEPSAGLSPVAIESMYSLLTKIKKELNITIVLIEQNINKAISFCDRCVLLSQGKIGKDFADMEIQDMRTAIMKELGL